MTVPGFNNTNTAAFAVYNYGILQILSYYNYSCYYYCIENQTMQLVPILGGLFINAFAEDDAFGSL